jgi:DNA-binding CsgD family transcriptional regulator
MDLRSVAIVILDHEQKILFASSGAGEVLDEFPALRAEQGRWSGPLPAEGELVEVEGAKTGAKVRLAKTWISNGRPEVGYTGIVLCPIGRKPELQRSRLMIEFRLTPAELRLAELLVKGRTPLEASVELEITLHTVRTYLKRLYRKAGVRSQATLICALNRALE